MSAMILKFTLCTVSLSYRRRVCQKMCLKCTCLLSPVRIQYYGCHTTCNLVPSTVISWDELFCSLFTEARTTFGGFFEGRGGMSGCLFHGVWRLVYCLSSTCCTYATIFLLAFFVVMSKMWCHNCYWISIIFCHSVFYPLTEPKNAN